MLYFAPNESMARPIRILSNVDFGATWQCSQGDAGETRLATTADEFISQMPWCDAVFVYSQTRLALRLAAVQWLRPRLRRPLLVSDIQLRVPKTFNEHCKLPIQRLLLRRVQHFFNHFTDVSGYRRHFGIRPERCTFVAYKPNLRRDLPPPPRPEGEYVLAFGQSERDFDSFLAAMERLPLPGAMVDIDPWILRANHSLLTRPRSQLPANVRLLPHSMYDPRSVEEILLGARLVVITLRKTCLQMVGSAYNAMLLGKCVLLTEGPAVNGLFRDEVLTLPAEDPAGIARVIERAWNDDQLRQSTAAKGYQLACSLGNAADLRLRLLEAICAWLRSRPETTRAGQ